MLGNFFMQKLRETKLKTVSYQPNVGGRPACRRGHQATSTAAIHGISLDQLYIHIAWLCFLVFCDLICDWPPALDTDTGSTLTALAVGTQPGPPHTAFTSSRFWQPTHSLLRIRPQQYPLFSTSLLLLNSDSLQ